MYLLIVQKNDVKLIQYNQCRCLYDLNSKLEVFPQFYLGDDLPLFGALLFSVGKKKMQGE